MDVYTWPVAWAYIRTPSRDITSCRRRRRRRRLNGGGCWLGDSHGAEAVFPPLIDDRVVIIIIYSRALTTVQHVHIYILICGARARKHARKRKPVAFIFRFARILQREHSNNSTRYECCFCRHHTTVSYTRT